MNRIITAKITCLIFIFLSLLFSVKAQELKLEILNGHSSGVMAVAASSDGKFALTGSTDWTALLWDLETGKQLRRFGGDQSDTHEMHILSVAFSRDSQFVLTASHDKSARLWNTATGKQIQIFKGHDDRVVSAAISNDNKFVVTASDDKTARIWDAKTGKQLFKIHHNGKVNSVAFSPDGQFFLTGGEDKIARLYETRKPNEPIRLFAGHTGEIKSVGYSPDGSRVLTGGDVTVRLWDSQTSAEVSKFELENSVLSVVFTPNGKSIVAGTNNTRSVYLLDITTEKTLRKIDERGYSVAATEKEILIAGGNVWSDNIVTIYPIAEPQKQVSGDEQVSQIPEQNRFLSGKSDVINSVAVSPDFRWIVTGAKNDTSGLWNLTTGQMIQWWKDKKKAEPAKEEPTIQRISFRYDLPNHFQSNINLAAGVSESVQVLNSRAVAFALDGSFFLYADDSIINGQYLDNRSIPESVLFGFEAHDGAITTLAIAPHGKSFVTGSTDKTARLWQGSSKPKTTFAGHDWQINSVAYSPNGGKIATASADQTVRLWNAETGELIHTIKGFTTYISEVEFSPDGKTLATASGTHTPNQDNIVRLWNAETGQEIRRYGDDIVQELSGHIAGFTTLAFSPDGRFLLGGSYDGKSYLWETATGTEVRRFEIHSDTVRSVHFSADGRYVITGSNDATTRIWNAATGEEICKLVVFRDGTWAVIDRFGRYDAPNGGEIDGIQWVFGTETIALNQLKDIYYTPNLLPRLLGYNKEPLADVRPLKDIKLFPEIVENNFDKASGNLTVKIKNRGGGIGAVRVMVNDKMAAEDARSKDLISKLKANPNLAEIIVTVNLKGSAGFNPNGENKIEVITNDFDQKTQKSFVSSNPKTSARGTEIFNFGDSPNNLPKPTLYAIVGGVSDYNGTALDLNFAAKDAEDFANALGIAARGLFCETPNCTDKVKIKLLTTNSKVEKGLPTKKNFRAAFEEVAKNAKPEDILVVYLAGHGTSLNVGDAETYFYLTQESEVGSKDAVAKNPERAISNTEILNWLTQEQWRTDKKGINARNQVLILDTCAAGAFENALTKNKQRDLSADQIRALEKLKDRTGLQILMGSAANQSAYEASQYGQGLLTYALLEGIKGAALKNQTSVETGTLFDWAVNRVPKMDISGGASGLQSPRVFGSTSIPIGLIKTQTDKDAIKIQASPLPIFGRASLIKKDENDDTLNLIGAFGKRLDEAGNPQSRGDGGNQKGASLVFIDESNFPGAYRVTGAYTEENGLIIIEEIILKKDGKTIAKLEKVSGKDADEVTENLLKEVLKGLANVKSN